MTNKKLVLYFSGNRAELYKQLKIWSAENDKSMNGLIMELLNKFFKNKK
jgi:hypothetical protein